MRVVATMVAAAGRLVDRFAGGLRAESHAWRRACGRSWELAAAMDSLGLDEGLMPGQPRCSSKQASGQAKQGSVRQIGAGLCGMVRQVCCWCG